MSFVRPLFAASHPTLVCLDLQEEQLSSDFADERDRRRRCAETCRDVLARARRLDWRIVHLHRPPAPGRVAGGSRPIGGLEPRPTEPIFVRPGPSAFSSAAFRDYLKGAGHPQLAVIGFSLEGSALFTAVAAQEAGVPLSIVKGAVDAPAIGRVGGEVVETVLLGALGAFTEVLNVDDLFGRFAGAFTARAANIP